MSASHQSQLAELLSHVTAPIDRYRAGEIDAYAVDETIDHYYRAAGDLWKFCLRAATPGGGATASRAESALRNSEGYGEVATLRY